MLFGNQKRVDDVIRFYNILEEISYIIGGPSYLSKSSARIKWPERGVYFFMENNEFRTDSGEGLRIVRVGTHALKLGSKSTLWNRLSQHRGTTKYGGGNHRGSIFRLLIGEALSKIHGIEVETWGKGSSAPKHIRQKEEHLERMVSEYIGKMPFLWIEVPDSPSPKSLRGYIERNSIALLSNYRKPPIDPPSPSWLGNHSNRKKVRESGLWNQNHVDEDYDFDFLDVLHNLARQMREKWSIL